MIWHSSSYQAVPGSEYILGIEIRKPPDNSLVASASTGPQLTIGWKPLNLNFTVPTDGKFTILLINLSTQASDNDFAIDNIPFTGQNCIDTDGDGLSDNRDLDSDNDGCPDRHEAGYADADNDGIWGTGPVSVDVYGMVIG